MAGGGGSVASKRTDLLSELVREASKEASPPAWLLPLNHFAACSQESVSKLVERDAYCWHSSSAAIAFGWSQHFLQKNNAFAQLLAAWRTLQIMTTTGHQ